MAKPDFSTWLTKAQASAAIGVSTKTIEKLAEDKKLQQAQWKRPEGGPRIAVYHPGDVERLRKERNPDAEPFVLPAAADEKPPADTRAVAVRQPGSEQFIQALMAVIEASSQNSQKRGEVRLSERLYLTIADAAEYTGLGTGYLRRLIEEGKLELLKGAGPRGADVLRRKDLEGL
jgi:excisionase family DNA binding protein